MLSFLSGKFVSFLFVKSPFINIDIFPRISGGTMAEKAKDIKTTYTALAKQHKLPSYEELNKQFDIDTIDPESKHLEKEVAKKIFERIELFKKILESAMQPDVSILSMQESEYLTESDHETIADILRRLMLLDRTLLIAELQNDEALYADFIHQAAAEWPRIKKELAPIIGHMQQGWSTKHPLKQVHNHIHHYLG
jgi:hypothetical protein